MRVLAALVALSALLAAGPRPAIAAREERGPGPLPWRVGYEVGFCADAAAFPDSTGYDLQIYVRIRPSLIADLTRDGQAPMPIRLTAMVKPLFGGGTWAEREQVFTVAGADTTEALGEVVVLRFPARPGRHRLAVRIETRRRQLARRGVEKPESVRLEGDFTVPAPQAGRHISDIQFVWADSLTGAHMFGGGGMERVPNPERLYGLYATDLRAHFTALGTEPKTWEWVARALDSTGTVVAEQRGNGPVSRALAGDVLMDMSGLPAGRYDLEIKAWQEGDVGALLRRARFSVGWQVETWTRDPQAMADDVHFLFNSEDEERFPRLEPGEQERALDRFWAERDPTPDTGDNEARRQYLQRVQFANRTYGRYGLGRGMFSDMGRTFIRYGEPEEVIRQVMPSLDDNLERIIYELARTESRALGSIANREVGADTRPFELWIYQGNIPLPIDAAPHQNSPFTAKKRMVFLFVDEHWLGDYRLLYSGE